MQYSNGDIRIEVYSHGIEIMHRWDHWGVCINSVDEAVALVNVVTQWISLKYKEEKGFKIPSA